MKQEEIYPFFPSFSEWALPVFDLIPMFFYNKILNLTETYLLKWYISE